MIFLRPNKLCIRIYNRIFSWPPGTVSGGRNREVGDMKTPRADAVGDRWVQARRLAAPEEDVHLARLPVGDRCGVPDRAAAATDRGVFAARVAWGPGRPLARGGVGEAGLGRVAAAEAGGLQDRAQRLPVRAVVRGAAHHEVVAAVVRAAVDPPGRSVKN